MHTQTWESLLQLRLLICTRPAFSLSPSAYIYHHTRDETRHKQKAWEEKRHPAPYQQSVSLNTRPFRRFIYFSFSPPFPLSLHVLSSRPRVTHNPVYGRRKQTNKKKHQQKSLPFSPPFHTKHTLFLSLSHSPHRASSPSLSLSCTHSLPSFAVTLSLSLSLSVSHLSLSLSCFAPPPLRVPPCSVVGF